MLLSINSKVEIKEISRVNTKKDFHLHRTTFRQQAGGPKRLLFWFGFEEEWEFDLLEICMVSGLPLSARKVLTLRRGSLHVVAICLFIVSM